MRNLIDVIDRMIEEIPQVERADLIYDLRGVASAYQYTAPELMGMRWEQCADVLNSYIPYPKEDWHYKVQDIFADRETLQ